MAAVPRLQCARKGRTETSPMGHRSLQPLSDAFLPYRTVSFLLASRPSQPEFPPGPLPWARAGSASTALLQGALASNLRAWQK